jgi:hypothetical protein
MAKAIGYIPDFMCSGILSLFMVGDKQLVFDTKLFDRTGLPHHIVFQICGLTESIMDGNGYELSACQQAKIRQSEDTGSGLCPRVRV